MKKQIYERYDKNSIASLKRAVFEGRIIVVVSEGEARRAVDFLLSQPILGVDTETRPSFRKGSNHKVSLLQVATKDICFLFRLNYLGLNADIVRLLEDTAVPKIGLSWHDDLHMLHALGDFKPGNFIDLQDCVGQIGIKDLSLQKVYANIFGMKISKGQRLTNWEADVFTDNQKLYAATDAWACIKLYEEIERLKTTGDYELVIDEENDIQKDLSQKG